MKTLKIYLQTVLETVLQIMTEASLREGALISMYNSEYLLKGSKLCHTQEFIPKYAEEELKLTS